jgi:hypothetical protein
MTLTTKKCVLPCLALLAFSGAILTVQGAQQRQHSRAEFMRTKLEYSKKALEGITLEDYDTIAKSAKALRLLSEGAEWEVPTIPNATEYVYLTREFQRLCDEMAQKARQKSIDGATLSYLSLTMNCVNCHKYVRGIAK